MACSVNLGGPTPPASPIPVSTEAADTLKDTWQNAVENAQNGQVSVTLTEQQLTSLVALKLAEQQDPLLRDVQVYLRDGQIQLYGTAEVAGVSAPALVALSPSVNAEGQFQVAIVEADFGPVPVPDSVLESLSDGINQAMATEIGKAATRVKLSGVAIGDGQMTLTGTLQE